jgi:hypothetical protein
VCRHLLMRSLGGAVLLGMDWKGYKMHIFQPFPQSTTFNTLLSRSDGALPFFLEKEGAVPFVSSCILSYETARPASNGWRNQ